MNINGVSFYNGANAYQSTNVIPEYIKKKLLELGFDPESVSSLQEALNIVAKAERQKQHQEISIEDRKETAKMEDPLLKKAKALAAKIGIQVSEDDVLEDVLSKIQTVLNKLLKVAENEGDEDLARKVLSFQHELDRIIEEKNGGGEVSNDTIYNILDAIAQQNKYTLGL